MGHHPERTHRLAAYIRPEHRDMLDEARLRLHRKNPRGPRYTIRDLLELAIELLHAHTEE